jgi:hypothetical protein
MSNDSLDDALVRVRSLIVDLERHIDRGSAERDLAEVGRAWVRASEVERILRSILPADALPSTDDIPDLSEHARAHADGARDDDEARPPR